MNQPETKHSPMMAQWHACKENAPDALLLFRLGDFYEAFYEDAALIAKELDLTLTRRQDVPMSGIPHHTASGYIDKLVAKGFRVAIAEQMEDAKSTKGIVRREIVRIITPGTLIQSSLLTEKSNNFLVCLTPLNALLGLAILDITTADFRVMEFENEKELQDELFLLRPAELLTSEKCKKAYPELFETLTRHLALSIHIKDEWHFDIAATHRFLTSHFKLYHLDGFGIKGMTAAIISAGALLAYVKEELNLPIDPIDRLEPQIKRNFMAINSATQRHLELTTAAQEGKGKRALLDHIDATQTSMGGRLLKEWLTHPLLSLEAIKERQDGVEYFLHHPSIARELKEELRHIRDLERMVMRIEMNFASPKDLISLALSLERAAAIRVLLEHVETPLIAKLREEFKDISPLTELVRRAIDEAAPLRLSDGNVIKEGFHAEIDELRLMKTDHHSWIARYQTELRETTNIRTLKVGYTRAFGYYIEVSRSAAEKMPDYFQRRQTLVSGERFITPELKEHEYKMLHSEERIAALEHELFHQIRQQVASHGKIVRECARSIAAIDTLASFAHIAERFNYVRPTVDTSDLLQIEEGRHPVVELALQRGAYVSNDAYLDQSSSLLLITGPNMAGKSTYIRQVALIVILAQIGSFVPAKKAHIGIVDKVFSRIGASDDLSSGQSTFMVEMTETAEILYHATDKSLVILDEIGRGTSTYDGISIAWSVAEHLLQKKVKTLFATHYSELTRLEEEKPEGVVNLNVAVHESGDKIVFLHRILKGAADKSYGIHVAKLAGLPHSVIKRAKELLSKLEKGEAKPKTQRQLELFAPPLSSPVLDELHALDLNQMTPLDAHRMLALWQQKYP